MRQIIFIFLNIKRKLGLIQSVSILFISIIGILALLIKSLTFFLPFTYIAF